MANENKEKKTGRFGQFFKEVSGEVKKLAHQERACFLYAYCYCLYPADGGSDLRAGSGIRRGPRPACKPVIQETLI